MSREQLPSLCVQLVLVILLLHSTVACPGSCVCKWKNGKQTVECVGKSLLSIPGGMDPGTQVLDMTDNKLDELHSEIFLKMDLINLQRIYLARCRIHSIDERTFRGLTNLVELDLSGNALEAVPTDAFLDCTALMRLTLNANPIKSLRRASFARLAFLNTLEMSDCELEEVEAEAFQGLLSLEWLRLDGNQLRTLGGRHTLPDNLRGVELQGNPWSCDCYLLEMRTWLKRFNGSQTSEPTCDAPARHAKRPIKTIAVDDLACMPHVSPTSLYLELQEGKNVTLLCNVHAVPEAKVSWWYDGQLLQNDTLVSPGLRLLYYIEEGGEEKRSELYIYNSSPDDNGTFVCTAENPAGAVSANYTIRIIVKEEPIVIDVVFPFEYVLAAVVGAVVLCKIIIIVLIVCIVRCRRNRKRMEKREKTKEVALQYQQNTTTKCAVTMDGDHSVAGEQQLVADGDGEVGKQPVISQGDATDRHHQQHHHVHQRQPQDILFYSPPFSKDMLRTMSPVQLGNQIRSPISLRRYQLEQNPDLINDTEQRRKEDSGGIPPPTAAGTDVPPAVAPTLVQFQPISCMRGSRKLYSLHSWDAACSMDADGYPPDYGLPKITLQAVPTPVAVSAAQGAENFYRTLPYNRAAKRQSAAIPLSRYSREAEFLSRSAHPAPYEHYCPDVRYTADGYLPKHENGGAGGGSGGALPQVVALIPSPPEGYKTESGWEPSVKNGAVDKCATISRRCVGAQTEAGAKVADHHHQQAADSSHADTDEEINQSPDEGYVGEQAVTL